MAAIRLLLGIVCLAFIGSGALHGCNMLGPEGGWGSKQIISGYRSVMGCWAGGLYTEKSRGILQSSPKKYTYKKLIPIARAELWVREETGNNDGRRVEEYLAAVGLKKGDPYCAAFVSWVFKQAGYAEPRTGWSPALFPAAKLVKAAMPGNVFGIYFPALKRIAHCGFVERVNGDWITTIEGNTNVAGSREGEGVYRRLRHVRGVKRCAELRRK